MNRIKELREKNNMKQEILAQLLCVTPSTISRYENERYPVPSHNLIKLSDIFYVSIDYILCLTPCQNGNVEKLIVQANEEDIFIHYLRAMTQENRKLILKTLKILYKEQEDKRM